jgi:hypothetical protein
LLTRLALLSSARTAERAVLHESRIVAFDDDCLAIPKGSEGQAGVQQVFHS